MLTAPFYQYWGKYRQGDQTDCYHLLAYHNLDVTACRYQHQLVKHNFLQLITVDPSKQYLTRHDSLGFGFGFGFGYGGTFS